MNISPYLSYFYEQSLPSQTIKINSSSDHSAQLHAAQIIRLNAFPSPKQISALLENVLYISVVGSDEISRRYKSHPSESW